MIADNKNEHSEGYCRDCGAPLGIDGKCGCQLDWSVLDSNPLLSKVFDAIPETEEEYTPEPCPDCGSKDVGYRMPRRNNYICQCRDCGNSWFELISIREDESK